MNESVDLFVSHMSKVVKFSLESVQLCVWRCFFFSLSPNSFSIPIFFSKSTTEAQACKNYKIKTQENRKEAQSLEQSIWFFNLEQNNEKCSSWKCYALLLLFEIILKTEQVLVASFFSHFLAVIDAVSFLLLLRLFLNNNIYSHFICTHKQILIMLFYSNNFTRNS